MQPIRSLGSCLILLGLVACGGGGSHDSSTPEVPTYPVTGTVSGLVGTLILRNNDADDLIVSAAGPFEFDEKLVAGDDFDVTIADHPRGQNCEVSEPSGTMTNAGTDIVVRCVTLDSSFNVAFTAEPTGPEETGGLYVLLPKDLGKEPVRITAESVEILGYAIHSDGRPHTLMYRTVGAAGGDHLWALDMAGTSQLQPRQVTSLTLNEGDELCRTNQVSEDLNDPRTTFFLMRIDSGTDACVGGPGPASHYLIRIEDEPTVTPTTLPTLDSNIQPLYGPDGSLGGIWMVDTDQNLKFFPDATFTNPQVLLTGVLEFLTTSRRPARLCWDLSRAISWSASFL